MPTISELIKSSDEAKLIKKTGLSPQRLQALAAGSEPSLKEARLVAKALGVSIQDVLGIERSSVGPDILFRNASNAAERTVLSNLAGKLECSLDLLAPHNVAGPWWGGHFSRQDLSFAEAERNASLFRRLFCDNDQLSPLLNLPTVVVEKLQVLLFVVNEATFDGASMYVAGVPFVFVSARFVPRMLFTLAHEIGHLVAHHDPSKAAAFVDSNVEAIRKGENYKLERYAHAFASTLLMPAHSVGVTLKKIKSLQRSPSEHLTDLEILLLAQIFGVSFHAAARRCEDLQLIERGAAVSLAKVLSDKYGSPEKRALLAGLPPRPKVEFPRVPDSLVRVAVERIRTGDLSIGRASAALGLSIEDLISANAPTVH